MKLVSMGARSCLVGLAAVLAIGSAGVGVANAAGVNTGNAGAVTDVSGDDGVQFAGGCNYAVAAVAVNTNEATYVAEGATVANWPLASTSLRCAYHLSDGSVVAFERALPGSASAIAGTFKAPIGGVIGFCYHATGIKLDNTAVQSHWVCT